MTPIALIDYRAGNLTSVKKALAAVGAEVFVPDSPAAIGRAHGVVVPGVGHFGATTAIDVQWTEAILALIGVGRGNPYGHPVRAVLERLRAAGTAVFRTDHEGQIEVRTDGRKVEARTWRGRRYRR